MDEISEGSDDFGNLENDQEQATDAPTSNTTNTVTNLVSTLATESTTAIGTGTSTESSTGIATVPATDQGSDVSKSTGTDVATDAPTAVETDVASDLMTELGTDLATSVATGIATVGPTDLTTESGTDAATGLASDIATDVSTKSVVDIVADTVGNVTAALASAKNSVQTPEGLVSSHHSHLTAIVVLLTFIVVLLGLWIGSKCLGRCHRKRKERERRRGIYQYVQNFNVEDIDILKAPTGGYHGTYVNNLRHGVNDYESLCEKSTHDTVFTADNSDDEYSEDGNLTNCFVDVETAEPSGNSRYRTIDQLKIRSSLTKSHNINGTFFAKESEPCLGGFVDYEEEYADEIDSMLEASTEDRRPWRYTTKNFV